MPATSLVREKVTAIFHEIAPDRASRLCSGLCDQAFTAAVQPALTSQKELPPPLAYDIAFHLSDWHVQAAFIVALHLFPERFSPAEISEGVLEFFCHAPMHVATAAALFDEDYDGYTDYIADAIKDSKRSTLH
jgi:hypothetical protein